MGRTHAGRVRMHVSAHAQATCARTVRGGAKGWSARTLVVGAHAARRPAPETAGANAPTKAWATGVGDGAGDGSGDRAAGDWRWRRHGRWRRRRHGRWHPTAARWMTTTTTARATAPVTAVGAREPDKIGSHDDVDDGVDDGVGNGSTTAGAMASAQARATAPTAAWATALAAASAWR
eukprot:6174918-Pleurochrysis_carterae.AAC.1